MYHNPIQKLEIRNMQGDQVKQKRLVILEKNQVIAVIAETNFDGVYMNGEWVDKNDSKVWIQGEENIKIKIDPENSKAKAHYSKIVVKDGKEVKVWECGICLKDFKFLYTLTRHLPIHTDERNFKCQHCSKAFRQLSTLNQHKATHEAHRPYICNLCDKTFNRISTLVSHKRTHSEDKKHKCDMCNKAFHQKGNLKNHKFTHTDERPYKCNLCHKGFNQQSNLVVHKKFAHANGLKKQRRGEARTARPIVVEREIALEEEVKIEQWSPHYSSIPTLPPVTELLPYSVAKVEPKPRIVTVIKKVPTEQMLQLHEMRLNPFVTYYQSWSKKGTLCKALLAENGKEYSLVIPSKEEIAIYCQDSNGNVTKPKCPIVAAVIQRKDPYGSVETLLLPPGRNPEVVDTDENVSLTLPVFELHDFSAKEEMLSQCTQWVIDEDNIHNTLVSFDESFFNDLE